eukprot:3895373-Amphidinium_carterae.2
MDWRREQHLEAVKRDERLLRYVPERYRADHEIVFEAVRADGLLLEYAAEECKAEGGGCRPYMDLPWR